MFLCLSFVLQTTVARAQNPDDKNWSSTFGYPGLLGASSPLFESGIVRYQDTIVVAGRLWEMGQRLLPGVCKWTGKQLLPFRGTDSPRLSTGGDIRCIVVDSSGRLIIGGSFDSIDERPIHDIAWWDGTEWRPLSNPFVGEVSDLTCTRTTVYATGKFTCADTSLHLDLIAALDSSGWHQVGSKMPRLLQGSKIRALDSTVVVIGPREIALQLIGNQWVDLNNLFHRTESPTWRAPYFTDVTVFEGHIYLSGTFDSVAGSYVPELAKWDGASWSAVPGYRLEPPDGADGISSIHCIGHSLYVATGPGLKSGRPAFIVGADTIRNGAIWDGSTWTHQPYRFLDLDAVLFGTEDSMYFLDPGASITDGDTMVYGGFGSLIHGKLMTVVDTTQFGLSTSSAVESIASSGGAVYMVGSPTFAGQHAGNAVMRWVGGVWQPFSASDTGWNSLATKYDLAGANKVDGVVGQGDSLVMYGSFRWFGTDRSDGIALFDGKKWHALHDSVRSVGNIQRVVFDGTGNIFAQSADSGMIWEWRDSHWYPLTLPVSRYYFDYFGAMAGADSGVVVEAQFHSGNSNDLDAGLFKIVGDRVDTIYKYTIGQGFAGVGLLRYHNGRIYASGNFPGVTPAAQHILCTVDSLGWTPLGKRIGFGTLSKYSPPGAHVELTDMVFNGDDLYVTGSFGSVDSVEVNSIAHWDGYRWTAVGSGLLERFGGFAKEWPRVSTGKGLALVHDTLYVGGYFTMAGMKRAYNFSSYGAIEKNSVPTPRHTSEARSLHVFPDPVVDELRIGLGTEVRSLPAVQVFDELGRNVTALTQTERYDVSHARMHTSNLPPGVYSIVIPTPEGAMCGKFVVVR